MSWAVGWRACVAEGEGDGGASWTVLSAVLETKNPLYNSVVHVSNVSRQCLAFSYSPFSVTFSFFLYRFSFSFSFAMHFSRRVFSLRHGSSVASVAARMVSLDVSKRQGPTKVLVRILSRIIRPLRWLVFVLFVAQQSF